MAKVHTERGDVKGNRLEKRFGHPALHADLFTPMLHAKMMPLLSQVYGGSLGKEQTKLDEYGGQKMEAHVVNGGVKIAAIEQSELEYDLAMFRRDRGELDWDARSMASTAMMDNSSMYNGGTGHAPVGGQYDRDLYLQRGPGSHAGEHYEMATMDSPSQPLLAPLYHGGFSASTQELMQAPPMMYNDGPVREAPVHRPQLPHQSSTYYDTTPPQSRSMSPYQQRSGSPYGRPGPPSRQNSHDMLRHQGSQEMLRQQSSPDMGRPMPQRMGSYDSRSQSPAPPSYNSGQRSHTPVYDPRVMTGSPAPYQHGQYPSSQYSHDGHGQGGNLAGRGAHRG